MTCTSCAGDPYAQAIGGCRDCATGPQPPSPTGPSLLAGTNRAALLRGIKGARTLARPAQALLAVLTAAPLAAAAFDISATPLGRAVSTLGTLTLVAAIVVFIAWFSRCRDVAELLAPGRHRYRAGWAVGAWFVPVVMWWFPHRIARDIWRANGSTRGEWVVHAWWIAWLARTVGAIAPIELGVGFADFKLYELVANSAAGVLAILMIQQITAGQSRFAPSTGAAPTAT